MKTNLNLRNLIAVASFFTILSAGAQNQVSVNQLPVKAQKFVKAHFSSQKVAVAEKDSDFLNREYEVYLADGTKIEFDGKGNWTSVDGKHKTIPVTMLPKNVITHLVQNHPARSIVQAERKSWGYEVELANGTEIEYNNSGQFLRID